MSDLTEVLLSTVETRRFGELEGVIERGLGTVFEVGAALKTIRDERLYRTSYDNFDDYCRDRWAMDRTYAHRHIDAATVAEVLPMGNKPQNERQARELVPLKANPPALEQAWRQAASDGKPTAEKVKAAVSEVLGANGRSAPKTVACPVCGRAMRADKPAKGAV